MYDFLIGDNDFISMINSVSGHKLIDFLKYFDKAALIRVCEFFQNIEKLFRLHWNATMSFSQYYEFINKLFLWYLILLCTIDCIVLVYPNFPLRITINCYHTLIWFESTKNVNQHFEPDQHFLYQMNSLAHWELTNIWKLPPDVFRFNSQLVGGYFWMFLEKCSYFQDH